MRFLELHEAESHPEVLQDGRKLIDRVFILRRLLHFSAMDGIVECGCTTRTVHSR